MSRNEKINWPAISLLVLSLVAASCNAEEDESFIQADVYNALYEANVQCDEDLDQSRSEFISDMFGRNQGSSISMELLRMLLTHNVEIAKQSIADRAQERERHVAEVLRTPKELSDDPIDSPEASKDRHEKIEQIDEFLKGKRQYVEVDECVLAVLQKAPGS